MLSKTRSPNFARFRNKALVGAIVAALALGTAGTAVAQSTGSYALDSSGPWAQTLALQNFLHSVNNTQTLYGDVTAQVPGGDSIFISADGSGSPSTNSANTISALAVGNNATGTGTSGNPNDNAGNSIAMGLLGTSGGNSGLGILSGELNEGNTVRAEASDAAVATDLTHHTAGAVTTSDNTISVDTRINDASSTISGALPTTVFRGGTSGSAEGQTANLPVDTFSLDAQGGVMIGNAQVNADNSTTATASNDVIRTTDDTNGAVSADFTSNGNAISANFGGNRSANTFAAQGGGAVSYASSAVVANAQVSSAASGSAEISDSSIGTAVTGTNTFTGTVSQSNNSLASASQANAASNSLTFADGISVLGNGSAVALHLKEYNNYDPNNSVDAITSGDLVLQNLQSISSNDGTDGIFSSSVTNSAIAAQVNTLGSTDASVTVGDNRVQSAAGGNVASNVLSVSGAAFTAAVSVGNLQENQDYSNISGSIDGLQVGAYMAATGSSRGTATVSANTAAAFGNGNQATTTVNLAGTQFSSGVGSESDYFAEVGYDSGQNGNYIQTHDASIVVGNQQTNIFSEIPVADTATATNVWMGAYYSGPIAGGTATVNANGTTAGASGNVASTTLNLSGTNAQVLAFLGNNQDSENYITATTSADLTGIYVDSGAVANAALSVGNNHLASSATGNQGTNTFGTDFSNATLGDGGAANWLDPAIESDAGDEYGNTQAALALSSVQYVYGDIRATTIDSQAGVVVNAGNVSATPITVEGNSASASAIGGSVSNTLSPGVGTLSTDGGRAAQIAALSSQQVATSDLINASVDPGAAAIGQIYAQINGNISDSAVTVSSDSVSAFAAANMAGNGMAISGANFAPDAVSGINGYLHVDFTYGEVFAAYAMQNQQVDNGGERSASVSNGSMGAAVSGNVSNSPLTVDGNQASADARVNYANNALSLGGFSTLTTTAGLLNEQATGDGDPTDVSSSVDGTNIGAGSLGGNVTDSAVTLAGNGLSSKAIGNTGLNSFAVQAGQLSGNSVIVFNPNGFQGGRGVIIGAHPRVVADYTLGSSQVTFGETAAEVLGGQIGGGAGGNFNGGSLTISGNSQSALAQGNSASNALHLNATSATTSAALFGGQIVEDSSASSAEITTANAFAAYIGGALGTATATPVTVSANTLVAQAGLNTASNVLGVDATSAINSSGVPVSYASTGGIGLAGEGAVADFVVFGYQVANSSADASISPGLVGIEVAGGGIGKNGSNSGLTVSGNRLAAQASSNDVSNALSLTGASSISATTALNNEQFSYDNGGTSISASASNAQVGIHDDTGANINSASLVVSGNSLGATASANSASNAISVLPVALNAGSSEATLSSADSNSGNNIAMASNSLHNAQRNEDLVSATVSDSSIGVNPTAGTASPLLNSAATVDGNSAAASASGNSASNSIMLASLSSGVASSALVSNQLNVADISATASNMQIGVTAGGNSSSPVTVSGNTISATAVGNSATNHIGIGH